MSIYVRHPRASGGGGITDALSEDLDTLDYLIESSTGVVQLGTAGASAHSLGVGDVLVGDNLEVAGAAFVDGALYLNATNLYLNSADTNTFLYASAADQVTFQVGGDDYKFIEAADARINCGVFRYTSSSNAVNLGAAAATSHGLGVDDVVVGADIEIDGQLYLDSAKLSYNALGAIGCASRAFTYDEMVDGGGASGTIALTTGIPDGAVVIRAILHSLTGFTGDVSAVVTVGDGTDVDRYNTGTPNVFVTNASGVDLGVPSGTLWHDDAKSVTVTITTDADFSSVSAGGATIAVFYFAP